MNEIAREEALRQAVAPAGRALKWTEARCTVLGQFGESTSKAPPPPRPRWPVRVLQQIQVRAQRRSGGR
jgi:hypothetical protein